LGKPFARDLDKLMTTIQWAATIDVTRLALAVARAGAYPLLAIGSGGSQSVASFAAVLHRHYTGMAAEETTPLCSVHAGVKGRSVQIFTARGGNPDVLGCFSRLVAQEPEELMVLSCAESSPLAQLLANHWFTEYFGFQGPFEGEGFVATNSILAQMVLLLRAYAKAFGTNVEDIAELLGGAVAASWLVSLEESLLKIGLRRHVLVLFNELSKPAAVDIESKLSEVGLASVQLADFRNFAHGRHNWLDKYPSDTLMISIEIDEDQLLAARTLRLLPADIPVLRLKVPLALHLGSILAISAIMRLTGVFGKMRGLDPGRPGVPGYGSRVYRLNAWSSATHKTTIAEISIVRKSRQGLNVLHDELRLEEWQGHFAAFTKSLGAYRFSHLALDYDGTLCDERNRCTGLSVEVSKALESVLSKGLQVLVVTGRGRSVGSALRQGIKKNRWGLVQVAYYNGSDMRPLSFELLPSEGTVAGNGLEPAMEVLRLHPHLRHAKIEMRKSQFTVSAAPRFSPLMLHELVSDLLPPKAFPGLNIVASAHSVDVLAPGVSKVIPLKNGMPDAKFLCIGDSGERPGNDFDLLQEPASLSSHRTSQRLDSCWHIAPAGSRHSQSTLHYLSCLEEVSGGFGMDVTRLVTLPK
jgi:hypothetical protein